MQVKENVKVPRHWSLQSTGDRCTPSQRDSDAENVSIWWRHHVQCNKTIVMKLFNGWISEPRSGTSTSNARMSAVSGWADHLAPGMSTSLGPPFTLNYNDKKASYLDVDFITRSHTHTNGNAMGWLSWVLCIAKLMDANNLKAPLIQAMA